MAVLGTLDPIKNAKGCEHEDHLVVLNLEPEDLNQFLLFH